jgi:hypothetical protein
MEKFVSEEWTSPGSIDDRGDDVGSKGRSFGLGVDQVLDVVSIERFEWDRN